MIDFHTHILPNVDDGSNSIEQSLEMLNILKGQGVNTLLLTPHFYANDESVDEFIDRRNNAYIRLLEKTMETPELILGAEVRYYDGISHLQDLKKLRIEGTRFLLLEMPFNRWTDYAINEIIDIASRGKITLVLAHIERYLPVLSNKVIELLSNHGVLFQVNASFFDGFVKSRKAVKMLKQNLIHFIGTDSHNTDDRAPNMDVAKNAINKKVGERAFDSFVEFSNNLFDQNKIV